MLNKPNEQGVMIYLAMLALSAALATTLFISSVFVTEFKISKDAIDSAGAIYVADTAMEYTLRITRQSTDSTFTPVTITSDKCKFDESGLQDLTGTPQIVDSNQQKKNCDVSSSSILIGSDSMCAVNIFPLSSSATSTCTHIVTTGVVGGINRKMELVYPDL